MCDSRVIAFPVKMGQDGGVPVAGSCAQVGGDLGLVSLLQGLKGAQESLQLSQL